MWGRKCHESIVWGEGEGLSGKFEDRGEGVVMERTGGEWEAAVQQILKP